MKQAAPNPFYRKFIKAPVDILVAVIGLIVAFPFMLIVYVILYRSTGGDVFFTQTRIGKDEKEFKAYKFRTMNNKRGPDGQLLPDAERLTATGRFIRKTSLDELPQLFNVLLGDMSFVGPRPLLPEYLPYYDESQRRRHLVMPGITGLAQVNGRNLTTWEKRFEFDVQYVNSISLLLDLKILFMTVFKVVRSEGISAEGHATMPKFSEYIERKRAR
ncbi:MAG TPA: sugar transferase [Cyclobacteriaceae bacterium]|nr:sugar transferase [Cyclobacteriaceae bacterium]